MDFNRRTSTQGNARPITALAATISQLFGIDLPNLAETPAIDLVTREASEKLHAVPVDRCLIFLPDALGMHLRATCEEEFAKVRRICPIEIPVRSVVPPKTPVCFASMFTGAQPGGQILCAAWRSNL